MVARRGVPEKRPTTTRPTTTRPTTND